MVFGKGLCGGYGCGGGEAMTPKERIAGMGTATAPTWEEAARKLDSIELYKFDGVNETSVYIGSFNNLRDVTCLLPWHDSPHFATGESTKSVTLGEIAEWIETEAPKARMATVFVVGPMRTRIYQMGNYGRGIWHDMGTICGYA